MAPETPEKNPCTLMVFLKEFSEKSKKKNIREQQKIMKFIQHI